MKHGVQIPTTYSEHKNFYNFWWDGPILTYVACKDSE